MEWKGMSGQSWVRLWAGMTTDPKWKTISRKSGRPLTEVIAVFTHAMLLANEADARGSLDGYEIEDIASALDMEEEHVQSILETMEGRVIDNGMLSGWEKRQPAREDSGNEETGAKSNTQRVREFRERKKANETQCNAPKRSETQCNAPEAEAEAEAELKPVDKTHTVHHSETVGEKQEQPVPESPATPAGLVCLAIRQAGVSRVNPGHATLVALLDAGATVDEFSATAVECVAKGKADFAYILGTVRKRREDAASLVLHKGALPNAPPRQTSGRQQARDSYAVQAAAARGGDHGNQQERDISGESVRIA